MPAMSNEELTNEVTALKETVQELLVRLRHTPPIGTILLHAADRDPPAGFLLCNGDPIDLSKDENQKFQDLFNVIGFTYGGDNNRVFFLPDIRGVFPRFADKGRGKDPGRTLEAKPQAAATAMPHNAFVNAPSGGHTHSLSGDGSHTHGYQTFNYQRDQGKGENYWHLLQDPYTATTGGGGHSHTVNPVDDHTHALSGGDDETRPINMAFVGFIRY